ncbi:unnamed protein product, partial [Brassica oleracea]
MKKPSVTAFLIAFLLAAAVCTHGEEEEVKDSNGNPVKVGERYFIQPVKTESNPGGGLIPYPIRRYQTCPLGITETLDPNQPGLPVSFGYPFIIGRDTIETYSYINIEFRPQIWPVCTEFSRLWAVDYSSSAAKEPAIIIGGKRENQNSAFKIEKATEAHTYKLTTFYSTVGTTPGAFSGAPQLIVTNDEAKTLFVKFVKVEDDATTAT